MNTMIHVTITEKTNCLSFVVDGGYAGTDLHHGTPGSRALAIGRIMASVALAAPSTNYTIEFV